MPTGLYPASSPASSTSPPTIRRASVRRLSPHALPIRVPRAARRAALGADVRPSSPVLLRRRDDFLEMKPCRHSFAPMHSRMPRSIAIRRGCSRHRSDRCSSRTHVRCSARFPAAGQFASLKVLHAAQRAPPFLEVSDRHQTKATTRHQPRIERTYLNRRCARAAEISEMPSTEKKPLCLLAPA